MGAGPTFHAEDDEDVPIVNRPVEAPGAVRSRTDRVVYDFIATNAHFKQLEEFKDSVDRADGYEGLRAVIPARFRHHPNMTLLDDQIFSEPGKMSAAIWSTTAQLETSPGPGIAKSRLQSRLTMQLQVSTGGTADASRR